MAGFYKKDLDVSGLSRLVPAMSKSPLESLGKSMSQLDSILTNRDKEQYTKTALEGLKGAANTTDYLKGLQELDPTRLTKIGATSAQQNFANLSALENIQAEQDKAKSTAQKNLFDQQMEIQEFKLKQDESARKEDELSIKKGTANLDKLKFEDEKKQLLDKQEASRQTGDYVSGVQSLLSVDRNKYGDQIPLALSSLRDAYPEADVTKASDTVETLFEDKTSVQRKRDALEQVTIATQDYNDAYSAYQSNPTPENQKILEDKKMIKAKMIAGTTETKKIIDNKLAVEAAKFGKELVKGGKIPGDRYATETDLKSTDTYTTKLQTKEEKFFDDSQTIKSQERLYAKLKESIGKGVYKSGLIDNTLTFLGSITPKTFRGFTTLSTNEIMERVGLEGSMGGIIAEYLKELSGATATEQEFKRKVQETFSGSLTQEDVKASMFDTFIKRRKDKVLREGEALVKRGLTGEVYDTYRELKGKSKDGDLPSGSKVNGNIITFPDGSRIDKTTGKIIQ